MNKSGMKTNVDVNALVDFFSFRIMLMPRIIIALNVVVTVLGLAALVCLPVAMIYFAVTAGEEQAEMIRLCAFGFVGVVLGMLAYRIVFEYLILFFRINETLTEILRKQEGLPCEPDVPTRPASADDSRPQSSRMDLRTITLTPPEEIYVAPMLPQPESEIRPGDIVFDCPFCGHNHAISPKGAGIKVNCMKCGKSIEVPKATEQEPGAK